MSPNHHFNEDEKLFVDVKLLYLPSHMGTSGGVTVSKIV